MPDASPPAPPAAPYGPNTPAVRRFLQHFAALGPAEWDAAARAYEAAAGSGAQVTADRALARAVDQAGRQAERDAVVGPLVQLVRGPGHASVAELPPVAEAALAALLALVMRDVLPGRAFDALYAPFARLVPAERLE